jgi:hypothetical protein
MRAPGAAGITGLILGPAAAQLITHAIEAEAGSASLLR